MALYDKQTPLDVVRKLPFMPESERIELYSLLEVQSHTKNEKRMLLYIIKELEALGLEYIIDNVGNVIVEKGEAEFKHCVVSHMDTVHSVEDDYEVFYHITGGREYAFASSGKLNTGVGGDDKCGIYSCLRLLRVHDNIKCIFFTQEEGGCVGSRDLDRKHLKNVISLIQLDRWGNSDLICEMHGGVRTVHKDFLADIEDCMTTFGYETAVGLMTDSIKLWDLGVDISAVNVSCGYYQHHTNDEIIDVNELWNSIMFLDAMLGNLTADKVYPSKRPPYVNTYVYKAPKGKYVNGTWVSTPGDGKTTTKAAKAVKRALKITVKVGDDDDDDVLIELTPEIREILFEILEPYNADYFEFLSVPDYYNALREYQTKQKENKIEGVSIFDFDEVTQVFDEEEREALIKSAEEEYENYINGRYGYY